MVDSWCLLQMVTEWYFPVTEILSMVFHVFEIFQWHFTETRFFQCYKYSTAQKKFGPVDQ